MLLLANFANMSKVKELAFREDRRQTTNAEQLEACTSGLLRDGIKFRHRVQVRKARGEGFTRILGCHEQPSWPGETAAPQAKACGWAQ